MMRYQRVSPDCLPLDNGRKSNLRTCKEDEADSGRILNFNGFEGKPLRFRPGSTPSTSQDHNFTQFLVADSLQPEKLISVKGQNNHESGSGADILLQWGQRKRSRVSRAENRVVTDETSAQAKQMVKIHRRVVYGLEKRATNRTVTAAMPPPCAAYSDSRGVNHIPSMPVRETTGSLLSRNLEERSVPVNGPQLSNGKGRIHSRSAEKKSPQSPEKMDKMVSCSMTATNEKPKGARVQAEPMNVESVTKSEPEAGVAAEKLNLDSFEWPRIYIALSRKEKEEDFFAMKGTKLPQRPKKRAKNVDKTLQYCFPGLWLFDLTRSRYEVREKKCVKKEQQWRWRRSVGASEQQFKSSVLATRQKRKGLKGMESMDSDSE